MMKWGTVVDSYNMGTGSEIVVRVDADTARTVRDRHIKDVELRLDDGRQITVKQRKKIYATLNDIAVFLGYLPEEMKEIMKYHYVTSTGKAEYLSGDKIFSFADCSVETAQEFIGFILEFALEYSVPLSEPGVYRADDISRYLYACLKHKKCCVCGRNGEIHHVDTIGMGNNRRKVDDSQYRKMCLCRTHHTIAHQRGMPAFEKMYMVYGIVYEENG